MALIGTIETLLAQSNAALFSKALAYLQETDLDAVFNEVTPGNNVVIELDGKNLFAIYQKYTTKSMAENKPEGHKNYIDIQYVHSGKEQILVAPTDAITKDGEYMEERDLYFVEVADPSSFVLTSGMAAILYPDDIHAPGLAVNEELGAVQKIVFKVKIN